MICVTKKCPVMEEILSALPHTSLLNNNKKKDSFWYFAIRDGRMEMQLNLYAEKLEQFFLFYHKNIKRKKKE